MQATREQTATLRNYLTKIYDVCEEAQNAGVQAEVRGRRLTVRQLFEIEVTAYLFYVTAADGKISQEEVDFVNSLLSRDYSIDDCIDFIEEAHITGDEFAKTTPVSFKLLSDYTEGRIDDILISFYDVLGLCVAGADNRLEAGEDDAHRRFIYTLRGYKELHAPDAEG